MSEYNLKANSRPVEKSHLEIADTFQDAGTRPIEESSEFLIPNKEISGNLDHKDISTKNSEELEINTTPPLD